MFLLLAIKLHVCYYSAYMTFSDIKHSCKDELNDAQLRATPIRLAVMKLLEQINEPVDVGVIKNYLRTQHIDADPATIFRMMNSFTKKGITKQISFNEGKFRYELAGKPDHHHLVCVSCAGVQSFSDCTIPELEEVIKTRENFLVKRHALEFFGLCGKCQN